MKREQVTLNKNEIQALLSQPNKKAFTGLRDIAIMVVLLESGMRIREMLNLCVNDLDFKTGVLSFSRCKSNSGKGKCNLSQEALSLLEVWLKRKPDSDLLFTTYSGTPISDRYIRAMIKRRARKAGIKKDVHPYSFRHTFATNLYEKAKRELGHKYLSSTFFYIHPK